MVDPRKDGVKISCFAGAAFRSPQIYNNYSLFGHLVDIENSTVDFFFVVSNFFCFPLQISRMCHIQKTLVWFKTSESLPVSTFLSMFLPLLMNIVSNSSWVCLVWLNITTYSWSSAPLMWRECSLDKQRRSLRCRLLKCVGGLTVWLIVTLFHHKNFFQNYFQEPRNRKNLVPVKFLGCSSYLRKKSLWPRSNFWQDWTSLIGQTQTQAQRES